MDLSFIYLHFIDHLVLTLSMLLNLNWYTHRTCLVGLLKCLLRVLPDFTILVSWVVKPVWLVWLLYIYGVWADFCGRKGLDAEHYFENFETLLCELGCVSLAVWTLACLPCCVNSGTCRLWTWVCLLCCVISVTWNLCGLYIAGVTRPDCLHYFVYFHYHNSVSLTLWYFVFIA